MCAEIHKKNLPKGRKFTYIYLEDAGIPNPMRTLRTLRSARLIYRQDLSTSAIGACERAGAEKNTPLLRVYLPTCRIGIFSKGKTAWDKMGKFPYSDWPNVGKYTIHGSYRVFVLSQMCVFWGDVWFLSDGFITMLENILTFFPTIHICISKWYTSGTFEARMVSQHNCILEKFSLLLVCSYLCVLSFIHLCSDILHTKNN